MQYGSRYKMNTVVVNTLHVHAAWLNWLLSLLLPAVVAAVQVTTLTHSVTSAVTPTTPPPHLEQLYLGRGTAGRGVCPVKSKTPQTLVVWLKDGRVLEPRGNRVKVSKAGTLFIRSASEADEGLYACASYSPLGTTKTSPTVHIYVRGILLLIYCCSVLLSFIL
jgi:hypothetical protein